MGWFGGSLGRPSTTSSTLWVGRRIGFLPRRRCSLITPRMPSGSPTLPRPRPTPTRGAEPRRDTTETPRPGSICAQTGIPLATQVETSCVLYVGNNPIGRLDPSGLDAWYALASRPDFLNKSLRVFLPTRVGRHLPNHVMML